jgi:hypothetical protein
MNQDSQKQSQPTQTLENHTNDDGQSPSDSPDQSLKTDPIKPTQVKPKKTSLPVKTFLLILILAAITAVLIFIALQNAAKVEETSPGVVTPIVSPKLENPVQTSLTISSTAVKLATPSSYSTNIIINTGKNTVNKVQLEISYDPNELTNVSIETGKFFTNPQVFLKNVDKANGRISFAIGVQDSEEGILGQGVVAKLSFTAYQKDATTSITLLPKTKVTANDYSQSVLRTTINGLFNLNEAPFKATDSGK